MTSHQMEVAPTAMNWCGEEVVMQTLDTGFALLAHTSGETETIFQPASLTTVQECDGPKADEYIRMSSDTLSLAVSQCISDVGSLF